MATVKSSAENLTLNADGANNDIKFQSNGSEVASIDQAGVLVSAGGSTHADNVKAKFGTGNDLEIYHDGSHSYIKDVGTGNLSIQANAAINLKKYTGETLATFAADGAVSLYYDNASKLATTATGVAVTGDITLSADTKVQNTTGSLEVIAEDTLYLKCDGDNAGGESIHFLHGTTSVLYIPENGRIRRDSGHLGSAHFNMIGEVGAGSKCAAFEKTAGGGEVGNIVALTSSTQFNTTSDYRLKENVDYTWDATTRLKQLKPARFNFIADDTNTLVDGFLAHEVSSVVPEAISGTKDEVDDDGNAVHQGIDQSKLVPLLVKTIQELEARITALEA